MSLPTFQYSALALHFHNMWWADCQNIPEWEVGAACFCLQPSNKDAGRRRQRWGFPKCSVLSLWCDFISWIWNEGSRILTMPQTCEEFMSKTTWGVWNYIRVKEEEASEVQLKEQRWESYKRDIRSKEELRESRAKAMSLSYREICPGGGVWGGRLNITLWADTEKKRFKECLTQSKHPLL